MEIKAGEFKAKCLELMDWVAAGKEEIIITKHGKPVAKLVPISPSPKPEVFGSLKDVTFITGDIIAPIDVKWDADE